jgi:predicted phage terminase large subunit-like protein
MANSEGFRECVICHVERDITTLTDQNICPFCVDVAPPPSEPAPFPRQSHQTSVKNEQAVTPPPESLEIEPYVPPQFDKQRAITHPQFELADQLLCQQDLLRFIQRFRPKYKAGWVHRDICRRLEQFVRDVEAGKGPRLLLMMPPRSGKLLADETLVPTPRGFVTHGELRAGDTVFHPSGKQVRVLAVSEKDVADVKITFSDGSTFFCHENHEWTLYNRMRNEWQTIETGHFLRPTRFGKGKQVISGGRGIYQLPVVAPLQYEGDSYLLHPYVLGAWLGDGSAGKPCITGAKRDFQIIDKIVSLGFPVSTICAHKTTGVLTTYFSGDGEQNAGLVSKKPGPVPGYMSQALEALGIFRSKRIPEQYQRLSVALRLELLAGLIDTDGTTDKNSRVSITTVSRALADDIVMLCEGLGFRPYLQEVQPTLSSSGIQGKKTCYVVGFQPTCEIPVVLVRKRVTRFAQQRRVSVVSVERVEPVRKGHCIQVDSPDGLYVVGRQMIVTHNSEISSRHFPAWVLGQHPDWEIIAASHTASLTLSFSRYNRDLLNDPAYQSVFPETRLDPASKSVENWNLMGGGGYLAAGRGTGITGRGCFSGNTLLQSLTHSDMIPISSVRVGDYVYGYDHAERRVRAVKVIAVCLSKTKRDFYEVEDIVCTDDHEFCTSLEGGYTEASGLRSNMSCVRKTEVQGVEDVPCVLLSIASKTLIGESLPQMRWEEGGTRCGVQEMPHGDASKGSEGYADLLSLQENVRTQEARIRALFTRLRGRTSVLLTNVSRQISKAKESISRGMSKLWSAFIRSGSKKVLLTQMLSGGKKEEGENGELRFGILRDKKASVEPERSSVRNVWAENIQGGSSSHRSRRGEQQGKQSGAVMLSMSQVLSHVDGVCAGQLEEHIQEADGEFVVDIQTESGNFFVGRAQLLVHNCHCLVLDDLVKDISEADSATVSDGTWEWYTSTAYTRLAPGGGVLGLMTWWSETDWAGRIQSTMETGEGDQFEIVKYPAINEEGDEYILEALPGRPIRQYGPFDTPPTQDLLPILTRRQGTAVHPERYDTQAMLRIKNNLIASGQKRIWQSLYQQNPVPDDGLFFTKDMFKYAPALPPRKRCHVYQAWDFAITEKNESDYTVGTTLYQDDQDNLYVADVRRFRSADSGYIIDMILDYAQEYEATLLGFEDGQIWKTMQSQFDKRCSEKRYYPSYEVLKPLTDKMVRAHPLRGRMQAGKVWFLDKAPWLVDTYTEMTRFPAGKHDDIIDSLSWSVRLTLGRHAPKPPQAPASRLKSWKSKLPGLTRGSRGASHLAA